MAMSSRRRSSSVCLELPTRHVRGDAAVDHVEHEHGPFLYLGRVDRREHEIVLVEVPRDRLGAGGLGRIEDQFSEEASPRRIDSDDLLQLVEIARAGTDIASAPDGTDTNANQRHLPDPRRRAAAQTLASETPCSTCRPMGNVQTAQIARGRHLRCGSSGSMFQFCSSE
jgi:hypothetical protein